MATFDDVDRRIVAALEHDSRLSVRALAEKVNISRANAYARLARLAVTGEDPAVVCTPPASDYVIEPDLAASERHAAKLALYRDIYRNLQGLFRVQAST